MKVLCISGRAQSGKDTVASILKEQLLVFGKKVLIIHYADLLKYMCRQYFGWDGKKDEKGRELLQHVGTDIVRDINPDFWVNFVASVLTMFKNEWDYVIIADTRFPNEISVLKECGFDVMHIRVTRPTFDNMLTEEQKNHPSETSLDSFEYDELIANTTDIEELVMRIGELALYIIWEEI